MNHRLFVAIDPPEDVAEELALDLCGGLPGARWHLPEELHLTLRFLGEVDGLVYRDADAALAEIAGDPFELTLSGVGHFPLRGEPRTLWVGVAPCPELVALRRRVDRAMVQAGLPPERRKFSPHVTLARLDGAPANRVGRFLAEHALLRSRPFLVDAMHLYSSRLHPKGSRYTLEQSYPLGAERPDRDEDGEDFGW